MDAREYFMQAPIDPRFKYHVERRADGFYAVLDEVPYPRRWGGEGEVESDKIELDAADRAVREEPEMVMGRFIDWEPEL